MSKLITYIEILLRWSKLIVLNTLVFTLAVLAVTFVLPKRYTAVAQLLPPTDEGDLFGFTSILGTGIGGSFSRLRLGALRGATAASDVMAGILASRTILDRVAEECSIAFYYRIKPTKIDKIRKQLKKMTKIGVGDEGIVRISVEAKTPELAAKVANQYIVELDNFLKNSNISRGRNMRIFLEKRIEDAARTLAEAQESLKVFQIRHKVVVLDEETKAAIDAYARLKSQAYVKQAELQAIKDISNPDNPYFLNLQREVRAFNEQLQRLEYGGGAGGFGVGFAVAFNHLPEIGAEFARRYRDFRIQEETYAMLYQQYEYAKVLEARDAPIVTVLDYATPPQRHSFPRRSIFILGALIFSLLGGIIFAFINSYFESLRELRSDDYQRWQLLVQNVKSAFIDLLSVLKIRRRK